MGKIDKIEKTRQEGKSDRAIDPMIACFILK